MHRKANREFASVLEASACGGYAATMTFHQTAHQGEPDTEASWGYGPSGGLGLVLVVVVILR
jgi:hypothetical protein